MSKIHMPTLPDDPSWYGRAGLVLSVMMLAFVLSVISLFTYFRTAHIDDRANCLRPYSYSVDVALGHVLLSAIDRSGEAYATASEEYRDAVAARDEALKTC